MREMENYFFELLDITDKIRKSSRRNNTHRDEGYDSVVGSTHDMGRQEILT